MLSLAAFGCDDCQLRLYGREDMEVGEHAMWTGSSGSTSSGEMIEGASSDGGGPATVVEVSTSGSTGTSGTTGAIDLCGNGVIDEGEACDDGDASDLDECPSGEFGRCKATAHCGDGLRWAGQEVCDDGNQDDEDGCPSGTAGHCKVAAYCGDGLVWAGQEMCDDGNFSDLDACPSDAGGCTAPAYCGDGFVWAEGGEECEDESDESFDRCNDCLNGRYAFVTSTEYPGDLNGVSNAHDLCQMLAEQVGLVGEYRAWLADTKEEPADWMDGEFSGWHLTPCGDPVAMSWELEQLESPLDCNEKADRTKEQGFAWTSVSVHGYSDDFDLAYICGGWGDIWGFGYVGQVGATDSTWTSTGPRPCDEPAHLYCFEVAS